MSSIVLLVSLQTYEADENGEAKSMVEQVNS